MSGRDNPTKTQSGPARPHSHSLLNPQLVRPSLEKPAATPCDHGPV